MTGQPLRPSQFILTFGVGSIIETPGGPRVIGSFEKWGRVFKSGSTPSIWDFQITSSEISALLNNGLIFRIPTNTDLGIKDDKHIFKTIPFPEWSKCEKHNCLSKMANGISQCSECKNKGQGSVGQKDAIRFVRACKNGHLDDIDWNNAVHRNSKPSCNSVEFLWESGGGTSLKNIYITCKKCKKKINLQEIYNTSLKCSGRKPEDGSHEKCDEKSKVVLRGSSGLRIPEFITAVTIPPRETKIHRILEDIRLQTILYQQKEWTKKELLDKLRQISLRNSSLISQRTIEELENSSEEQIGDAIKDTININAKKMEREQDVKNEEIKALIRAAEYGHPPNPENQNPNSEFQVNIHDVRQNVKWGSLSVRITPIERLRVVIAQKGYRRLGTDISNKLVQTFYFDGENKWYPGIELMGEGIFIDKPDGLDLDGNVAKIWNRKYLLDGDVRNHPVFVWWHTFSHRLISALSLDSGYSSASIRERIYVFPDENGKKLKSGILIYTTQPGGDGTLGGLIDQVPKFENVIKSACRNIDYCSNDPLCSEENINEEKYNGAACHACLFLSETSCEHSNKYLDRNLLRGTLNEGK